jgi:hypothetical protein
LRPPHGHAACPFQSQRGRNRFAPTVTPSVRFDDFGLLREHGWQLASSLLVQQRKTAWSVRWPTRPRSYPKCAPRERVGSKVEPLGQRATEQARRPSATVRRRTGEHPPCSPAALTRRPSSIRRIGRPVEPRALPKTGHIGERPPSQVPCWETGTAPFVQVPQNNRTGGG